MLNIPISDFFECAASKELIDIFGTDDINSILAKYNDIEIIQKILEYDNQF